jgi:hypothetical protein
VLADEADKVLLILWRHRLLRTNDVSLIGLGCEQVRFVGNKIIFRNVASWSLRSSQSCLVWAGGRGDRNGSVTDVPCEGSVPEHVRQVGERDGIPSRKGQLPAETTRPRPSADRPHVLSTLLLDDLRAYRCRRPAR